MSKLTAILTAGALGKAAANVIKAGKLRHFNMAEFGWSLPFLSLGLMVALDEFRDRLGRPVIISPAEGALLRMAAKNESQHLFGRAADIMLPQGPSLATAAEVARQVGFTGIGVYPMWQPYAGLHLDVRPDRSPGNPATWGMVRQVAGGPQIQVSMAEALTYA